MEAWRKELYHHGILGMKWGVRRYQNKDGSYTSAGRKRYGISATGGAVDAKMKLAVMPNKSLPVKKKAETSKPSSGSLESRISKAAKNTKVDSGWGDYNTSVNALKIARNVSGLTNLPKEDVDSLLGHGQKATDINNKMFDQAASEANTAVKTAEFKKDLDSRLEKDFGVGCDDKELFDMVRDDYCREMIQESKYSPKTAKLAEEFNREVDAYYDEAKKITDRITVDYGDTKVVDTKDISVKYKDVVQQMIYNETDASWVSYLGKHGEEIAWYDNDKIPFEFPSVYTMEEYNQNHKK